MVQINFNAQSVAPLEERGAVPAGWYNVAMDKSEAKPTKDGAGMYLECQFAVTDGAYKGARFWTRLNIRNNNPQAVEIAYRELSAIAHACGVMQVADTSMLHNIPIKVKVSVRKSDGYDDQNDIKAYKPANHAVETVGASPFGGAGPAGGFQPPVDGAPQQQTGFQPPQTQMGFQQQAPQQQAPQQEQPWQQAGQQPWQQGGAPVQQQQPQQQMQQQTPQQQMQQQQPQQAQQMPQQAAGGAGGGAVPPWLQNQQG